jgi:hypothetical protein
MHWVFKALAAGDLKTAWRGLGSISRYGNSSRQFAHWLFTANGRFFGESCTAFFDRHIGKLKLDESFEERFKYSTWNSPPHS